MDVALGHDEPPLEPQLSVPVAHGDAGGVPDVAGDAHRGRHPQGHRVGEGQLHLALAPLGAQDDHVLEAPLGARQGHPLGAGELSGLAQVLNPVEPVAHAEQRVHIRPGQMDMTA